MKKKLALFESKEERRRKQLRDRQKRYLLNEPPAKRKIRLEKIREDSKARRRNKKNFLNACSKNPNIVDEGKILFGS